MSLTALVLSDIEPLHFIVHACILRDMFGHPVSVNASLYSSGSILLKPDITLCKSLTEKRLFHSSALHLLFRVSCFSVTILQLVWARCNVAPSCLLPCAPIRWDQRAILCYR